MLNPSTASISSPPRTKPGHASARSKSAQLARCGAKVLVSCWNPPTAIRAIFTPSPPRRTRPVTPSPHCSQPVSWRQSEQRGYCLAEYREILFYRKIENEVTGRCCGERYNDERYNERQRQRAGRTPQQ